MGGRGRGRERRSMLRNPQGHVKTNPKEVHVSRSYMYMHILYLGITATCYICMYTWLYVSDIFEGYTYLHVHVRMYVHVRYYL